MGIRISNEMKSWTTMLCSYILCAININERSAIWCYGEISTNGVAFFPDLIFAQFVKLFGDYFSTISISFTYSVLMYYFFKSGGTIYKFHLLQKCMKLNKWFIPFFRSFCLNWKNSFKYLNGLQFWKQQIIVVCQLGFFRCLHGHTIRWNVIY